MSTLMTTAASDIVPVHTDLMSDVERVMGELRSASSALIAGVSHSSGRPVHKATDLQRALGLRATVAWQLFRIARAENPIQEVEAVPGPLAIKRVVEAARASGVAESRLEKLTNSIEAFMRLVQTHAGSRKAFNSMVASLGTSAEEVIDLAGRRAAFNANSYIWGLRARACLWSTTYFPGKSPDHICAASLRGPIGVSRLRSNAPYIVSGYVAFERDSEEQASQPEPLGSPDDPTSPDPRLLVPFCTRPLPRISSTLTDGQFVVTEMPPGPVGNSGAANILLADVTRDSRWRHEGEDKPHIVNSMGVATPFEVLVVDTMFHHSMFGRLTPRPRMFGRHSFPLGIKPHLYHETDTLPVALHASYLGRGLSVLESPDIPRYVEMYAHICEKLGLDPQEFDVYRCRVEYPILHAHVGVWFDLPERGNW